MDSLVELSKSWCDKFSDLNLGEQFDLPTIYINMVHETSLNDIMKILHKFGFIQCGLIFYGTSSFSEAEAIIVRFVTKDWQVIDLFMNCSIFDKKLKGNRMF